MIAQVGFSTNLARLLESPADRSSPLTGHELVERKVKLLSLMAGAFQPIDGNAATWNTTSSKISPAPAS